MSVPDLVDNIGTLVANAADRFGDRTALIVDHEGASYSFRELDVKVNQYGNALRQQGIREGEHVAVMLPNGSAFPFTWLALARLGCVMVPVNERNRVLDLQYVLADAEATALVIHADYLPMFREIPSESHQVSQAFVVGAAEGDGSIPLDRLAETMPTELEPARPALGSVMNIQYTSGTTGFPKGAVTTHDYWLLLAGTAGQYLTPDDVFLTLSPFYYMDPQWELLACLFSGAAMVLAPKISAENFVRCVWQYPVTWFWGWEEMLYLPHFVERSDHHLKCALLAAFAPELHQAFEERFHVKARVAYGMTEIGIGTMVPFEDDHMVGSGSMGKPPPFRRLRVVDESGSALPSGAVGELLVAGPGIFKGYYNKPGATAEAFDGDYFRTGDLVYRDEAGYYYFVGRKKDMIRRMGDNISAAEVEQVLMSHPKIAEAAVIGVPDPRRDEEIKAYIIPAPNETAETVPPEEIVAYCLERIARFKVPRYIEYRQDFPRSASFKVQKHVLKGEKEDLTAGCYDRFAGVEAASAG